MSILWSSFSLSCFFFCQGMFLNIQIHYGSKFGEIKTPVSLVMPCYRYSQNNSRQMVLLFKRIWKLGAMSTPITCLFLNFCNTHNSVRCLWLHYAWMPINLHEDIADLCKNSLNSQKYTEIHKIIAKYANGLLEDASKKSRRMRPGSHRKCQ